MRETNSFSLFSSVKEVRELLLRKLGEGGQQARDELEAALQEIETLWEELRMQAHALAAERQRYSEFFEYAPEAYLVTDGYGKIREANRAAAELLHVPASAVRDKPILAYVAESDRRDFRTRLVRASALPDGEASAWRAQLQPWGGDPVPAHFSARTLSAPGDGLAGLCWLVRRTD